MMTTRVYVSTTEAEAARILLRRKEAAGQSIPESLRKIAEAVSTIPAYDEQVILGVMPARAAPPDELASQTEPRRLWSVKINHEPEPYERVTGSLELWCDVDQDVTEWTVVELHNSPADKDAVTVKTICNECKTEVWADLVILGRPRTADEDFGISQGDSPA